MEVAINNIDKVRKFVDIVSRFDCDIDLVSGHTMVDAKSILGIFSLNIMKPMTMIIHDDEDKALIIKNSLKAEGQISYLHLKFHIMLMRC